MNMSPLIFFVSGFLSFLLPVNHTPLSRQAAELE